MKHSRAGQRLRIGCALFAAVSIVGCGESQKKEETPPLPVKVAEVVRFSGEQGVVYSASIVPIAQLPLLFKSAGYVTSILQRKGADGRTRSVQLGDLVKKDTVLATVRQQDYQNVVTQAQGQLEQALAAQAKSQEDMKRATALLDAGAITQANFDATKQASDSANGAVMAAQGALSQAQQSLADCELRAPDDLVIVTRNIELGQLVATGTQGFAVADTHLVKAVFGIPDTLLGVVRLGADQIVTTDTLTEQFLGKITGISPQADQKSRTFQVEVTIPNPKGLLISGMVASLSLGDRKLSAPVLAVPLNAVVSSGEGSRSFSVYIVTREGDKDVARIRAVQPGNAYGDRVEITNGVAPGERVVTNGATLVRDGQTLKIIP
jgi:RND family efflux transporter MFP subunit